MITRTIFIYDQGLEERISFLVAYGDYSHLNNAYVNSNSATEDQQNEINELFYTEDDAKPTLASFPHHEYVAGETAVVVVGFIP